MKGKLAAALCLLCCFLPGRSAGADLGDSDATRATRAGIKQFAVVASVQEDPLGDVSSTATLAIEAQLKAQRFQVVSQAAAAKLPGAPLLYVSAGSYQFNNGHWLVGVTISLLQTVSLARNPKVGLTNIETWSSFEGVPDAPSDTLSGELQTAVNDFIVAYQAVN